MKVARGVVRQLLASLATLHSCGVVHRRGFPGAGRTPPPSASPPPSAQDIIPAHIDTQTYLSGLFSLSPRDVKPQNLLITALGEVLLIDFGAACDIRRARSRGAAAFFGPSGPRLGLSERPRCGVDGGARGKIHKRGGRAAAALAARRCHQPAGLTPDTRCAGGPPPAAGPESIGRPRRACWTRRTLPRSSWSSRGAQGRTDGWMGGWAGGRVCVGQRVGPRHVRASRGVRRGRGCRGRALTSLCISPAPRPAAPAATSRGPRRRRCARQRRRWCSRSSPRTRSTPTPSGCARTPSADPSPGHPFGCRLGQLP